MASFHQPKDQLLTQSVLRAELDTFTKETLRRELEDLKISVVSEVVERLGARNSDVKVTRQPSKRAQRSSPEEPASGAGLDEEGVLSVRVPLMHSEDRVDGVQSSADINRTVEVSNEARALQGVRRFKIFQGLAAFVTSDTFEFVSGSLVMLSVMWLLFQAEYRARMWVREVPPQFGHVEMFFLAGFSIEIVLRVVVLGPKEFFCGPQTYSSWFDFCLVLTQGVDVFGHSMGIGEEQSEWAPMLRILRLFRILRLVRILKFSPDLRMLIVSIGKSVQPLLWVFTLILFVTAIFAILITMVVTEHKTQWTREEWESKNGDEQSLQFYFGSVERSIWCLYGTISGGRDWGSSTRPLDLYITPCMTYVFIVYTFSIIFAMMNVITSHFVDQTLEAAAQDRRESLVSNLMDAFSKTQGLVSEDDFMQNLEHSSMKSFLKDLYKFEDVRPEEIKRSRLFEMLDDDGSGEITRDELVLGCVKLTGSATSLDLAVLKMDVESLRRDIGSIVDMHIADGALEARPFKPQVSLLSNA